MLLILKIHANKYMVEFPKLLYAEISQILRISFLNTLFIFE